MYIQIYNTVRSDSYVDPITNFEGDEECVSSDLFSSF